MTRTLGATVALLLLPVIAGASPIYDPGVAASCGTCTFGTHLAQNQATGSWPGVGGSGINAAAGTALDGNRTYIWDQGGWVDGTVSRFDSDFAMMVWDVGVALDTVRLYTHQDHYFGGSITTSFVAQDVMEYSVWGSTDNVTFTLLSDVIGFNINGGGAGVPTYTFAGTAPTVVYRGGSAEFGILNAYTRDYTFSQAYQYYGIRSSSISLNYCTQVTQGQPNPSCIDADPELDALAFHEGEINPVPEPASLVLVTVGLGGVAARARRRRL